VSTITDNIEMGGGGGGGGEYHQECLFDGNRDNDEYDNDNEYNDTEDGKGSRRGADDGENPTTTLAMLSAGRPSGVWGRGRR
jgi:hypothetical protein